MSGSTMSLSFRHRNRNDVLSVFIFATPFADCAVSVAERGRMRSWRAARSGSLLRRLACTTDNVHDRQRGRQTKGTGPMQARNLIGSLGDAGPVIHPDAWVAPGAVVVGNVTLGRAASVWYGSVLR